mmetsp:Transcript_21380/g.26316  ORF Transcript_21380/g.26316 Transcript_21380/m.26316 type:complete len:99 (+) Transcript_21380:327-623(+)
MSLAKYKNGALHFNKSALERLEKGDLLGGAYKSAGIVDSKETKIGREKVERKKHTYEEIKKIREQRPDYMTGKKHKKSRGSMGKLHMKNKKPKKKFKK